VRDIDTNQRRRFLYSIPLPHPTTTTSSISDDDDDDDTATTRGRVPCSIPPTELHNSIKLRLASPSGDKIAIVRQEASQQVLEVWTNGGHALWRRILLPNKAHGKVVNDFGGFGRPSWNSNETVLVYAAERHNPETESFFADPSSSSSSSSSENGSAKAPREVVHRGGTNTLGYGKVENWGEKYSKQSALLDLYCVHVETGNVGRVENVPGRQDENDTKDNLGGYTLGQPVFSPNGESIVYTGWDAGGGSDMPRRLGLIYCQQRPSQLYSSSIAKLLERLASTAESASEEKAEREETFVKLTPENRLSRSPQFSPAAKDGTCKLVFLSSKKGFDTHQGCFALHSIDWTGGKILLASQTTIVEQVWDPKTSSPDGVEFDGLCFPGLFLQQLSDSCFDTPDSLVLTTQWGSRQKVIRVSLKDGTTHVASPGQTYFSDELLCLAPNGGLILSKKSPDVPIALFYVPASIGSSQEEILLPAMFPIASTRFAPIAPEWCCDFASSIEILDVPPSLDGMNVEIPVQSVLLLPDKNKYPQPAVIVVPHGGPHSCSSAIYMPSYAYLCQHGGYAILLVNYRGSTGFGQASIEALPSKIGDLDVKDVIAATMQLKESGLVDPGRIGICGGSHGGFLTGHCTSQYPDLFKAAAMRNPVVNIPSMVTSTDIPDWCYVEACGKYNWQQYRPPSPEELRVMWDKSPVRHVEHVKTPTLVALGLSDLRVPPSQGLEWYHTLRSNGVASKLLVYENDDHAIAGVASEADHWINIKRWFDEHL